MTDDDRFLRELLVLRAHIAELQTIVSNVFRGPYANDMQVRKANADLVRMIHKSYLQWPGFRDSIEDVILRGMIDVLERKQNEQHEPVVQR